MGGSLHTYRPLGRNLRAVPDRPGGQVVEVDFAARSEAERNRLARLAQRRADRAELAEAAGTVREFPAGAGDGRDMDPHFPDAVRVIIMERFGPPWRCDLSGFEAACWGRTEAHHIQPIGMGGLSGPPAAALAVASNGLCLCSWHHTGWAHRCPSWAVMLGVLTSKFAPPGPKPLTLDGGRTWIIMDDQGGFRNVTAPLDVA